MPDNEKTFAPLGPTSRLRLGAFLACGLAAAFAFYYLAGDRLDLGVGSPALGSPAAAPLSSGDARLTFSLAADRKTVLQGGDGLVRLELLLRGAAPSPGAPRQPTDFVVVLDHSGSMGGEGKMSHAREAVAGLIDRLGEGDRFALVIYDDRVEVPIPLAPATPSSRERWKRIAAGIEPLGGTNLAIGLDAGLGLLAERRRGGSARVVLISDGLANQGDTSRGGLLGRAAASAQLAAPLTAIGVGGDFDESLMGALADSGGGNFYFLRDAVALAQVFEGELGATRETVAQAVEVEVALPAGVELVEAAGYPLERSGHRRVFRPGSLFAGQERRIWLTFQVDEGPAGHRDMGKVLLRYEAEGRQVEVRPLPAPDVVAVADEATYLAGIDRERWSRSVAEEDYGKLRQKVAEHVKAGRQDAARSEIAAYTGKVGSLNAKVGSDEVSRNLEEARGLAVTVDAAFEGAGQEQKQNSLSKANQSAGWDARRAGAKKLPPSATAAPPAPPRPPEN